MLRKVFYLCHRGILLICPMVLLFACAGGASTPQRKKMPALNSFNSQGDIIYNTQADGTFGFPIRTGYVDLFWKGSAATFFAVKLPGQGFDSLALSLANSYKPFAAAMLQQWAQQQQQGTGILLDLRQAGEPGGQQYEYNVENAGYSTPVIVLYDKASLPRANTLIALMQSVPDIRCTLTSASHIEKDGARTDCFSDY